MFLYEAKTGYYSILCLASVISFLSFSLFFNESRPLISVLDFCLAGLIFVGVTFTEFKSDCFDALRR